MKIGSKSATLIWSIIFYHLAFQPPYRGFPVNPAFLLGLILAGYLTFNIRRVIFSPYRKTFFLTVLIVGLVSCLGFFHYFGSRSLMIPYAVIRFVFLAIIPVYAFIAFCIKHRLSMPPLIKNVFIFMVAVQLFACIAMVAFPPLKQIVFVQLFEYDDLKELNIALNSLRVAGFGQAFLFAAPIAVSFMGACLVVIALQERRYLILIIGASCLVFSAFNARIGIAFFGLTLLPLFPYYVFKRFGATVLGGALATAITSLVLWFSFQTDQGYEMGQWLLRAFFADSEFTESHLEMYTRGLFYTTFLPDGLAFFIGDGSSAFQGTSLNIESRTDSGYSGIFYAGGLLYFLCGVLLYAAHAVRPWKTALPNRLLLIGFCVAVVLANFKGNVIFTSSLLLSFILYCLLLSEQALLKQSQNLKILS